METGEYVSAFEHATAILSLCQTDRQTYHWQGCRCRYQWWHLQTSTVYCWGGL